MKDKIVKKLIMLTFLTLYAIITLVGCENGNIDIDVFESNKSGDLYSSGDEDFCEERKKSK